VRHPIAKRICTFLVSIGLPVRTGAVPGPSFLPGIAIEHGVLVFDEDRLLYPGDLLHEAGHLAEADEEGNNFYGLGLMLRLADPEGVHLAATPL